MLEGYRPPATKAPVVTVVMIVPHPVVHITSYNEEHIFHTAPSEGVGMNERMDKFQYQLSEMRKEIKSLRGKDLFGKNPSDLCLVRNVKIPHKFKVSDSENYKGNSFPQSHMVM